MLVSVKLYLPIRLSLGRTQETTSDMIQMKQIIKFLSDIETQWSYYFTELALTDI